MIKGIAADIEKMLDKNKEEDNEVLEKASFIINVLDKEKFFNFYERDFNYELIVKQTYQYLQDLITVIEYKSLDNDIITTSFIISNFYSLIEIKDENDLENSIFENFKLKRK